MTLARSVGTSSRVCDLEVGFEQVDDGEVGGRLAIRIRTGLEDQPAMGVVRSHELIAQAGLADAGLAHQPHHLPPPLLDLRPGPVKAASSCARPTNRLNGRCPCICSRVRCGLRPTTRVRFSPSPYSPSHACSSHQPSTSRPTSGETRISPGSHGPAAAPAAPASPLPAATRPSGSLAGYPPAPGPSARPAAAPDAAPLSEPAACGQLPERQRRLYRALRQLLQRVRHAKGDEEQRRRALQHHPPEALDLLHDGLLPAAGHGPGFIGAGLTLGGRRPGQLHRQHRHRLLLPAQEPAPRPLRSATAPCLATRGVAARFTAGRVPPQNAWGVCGAMDCRALPLGLAPRLGDESSESGR